MNKLRTVPPTFSLLTVATSALAAPPATGTATVLELTPRTGAPVAAVAEGSFGAAVDGDGGGQLSVSYSGIRVRGAVPLASSSTFRLALGAGYHLRVYDLDAEAGSLGSADLHRFRLGMHAAWALDDRWALRLMAFGEHASNLGGGTVDAFQPNVLLTVAWAPRTDLSLTAGVRFSRTFLQLLPTPVLGVVWKASDSVTVEAMLPRFARVGWRPNDRLELEARGDLEGLVWAVQSNGPADDTTFEHLEASATLGGRVRLVGPLSLYARGGLAFVNRYEFTAEDESLVDGAGGPSAVFRAGLTLAEL